MVYPAFVALIIAAWIMRLPSLVTSDIGNFPRMSEVLWILTLKIASVNLLLTIVHLVLLTISMKLTIRIVTISEKLQWAD